MRIEISGIDRTEFYSIGTLEIEDEINARTEASFDMVDTSGNLDLVDGQPVEIYDNSNNLIFGGMLFFPKRFNPMGTDAIFYKITCVDQQAIADRFLAAETYVNQTAGFIVKDMVDTYLAADGVWYNPSALSFDGVNDKVTIPAPVLFTGVFTQELWIRYSDNILTKFWTGGKPTTTIKFGTLTGKFFVRVVTSSDNTVTMPAINTWHHVAITRDANDKIDLIINGGIPIRLFGDVAQAGETSLGVIGVGGDLTAFFPGQIDEVRVWNIARTQADIQHDMNMELVGNEPGLVGYWKFNEGSGTTALDSTVNANNGTISGAVYTTDTWSGQSIQAGATLEKAVFPRQGTVTNAFDELAELSGFAWWIDPDKQAFFVERSTYAAPWVLEDIHMPVRSINVREDKSRYRNKQYVRGGLDITQEIALEKPTPKPDGVSKSFVVRFPIAEKPRIFINSVEVLATDIGVNGFDTGKKYYFTFNSNTITQDNSETTLADTAVLEITYRGLFPLLVVSENSLAIVERQAVEGGSGIYENIINEPKTNNRQVALDIANGKLRKFTKIERELEFETELVGLEAGQLLDVDLTKYKIDNGEFLIDRITITDYDGRGNFRYNVHAVDGEVFGGWTNFFKSLIIEGGKLFIREDEVLVILSSTFETQNWTEATATTVFACPIPSDTLFPSETLFPC